ncbi:hypothetical protein GCM10023197_23560 [Gordonia humi]
MSKTVAEPIAHHVHPVASPCRGAATTAANVVAIVDRVVRIRIVRTIDTAIDHAVHRIDVLMV